MKFNLLIFYVKLIYSEGESKYLPSILSTFSYFQAARVTSLQVQLLFFGQQLFHRLFIELIRDTAVHGTNRRTLRLFMESLAFGTLIRDNIIRIDTDRSIALAAIHSRPVQKRKLSFYTGTIRDRPFNAALIYSIIGAFRFTSPAIDTFLCDFYSHIFEN